ncbi:MAG: sirohydrochlorin chelatase [Geitlerinemataceae cyanobacterium]
MPQLELLQPSIELSPLPLKRPLLTIGHGTRDADGRQTFLDFIAAYQELDRSRPVIPCFLELTEPNIQVGIDGCVEQGYTEFSVLPILLFAARHNKFDVTNELDRARLRHPQLKFHYGRHFGISAGLLDMWHDRLAELDSPQHNPHNIDRSDTVLLFVGRGSSDPDANGDAVKVARMLWEGSGYKTVETCFIGITHPRLEEGFRRARFYEPKRIIVLPYFMFTGVLVKKIFTISAEHQAQFPDIEIANLPEIGVVPELMHVVRDREIETQTGLVQMNCESCKFRRAFVAEGHSHGHPHEHQHHHENGHHHHHDEPPVDPYAEPAAYHQRIWQAP